MALQDWDEKERLSQLWMDERTKNMANELRIKAVMQVKHIIHCNLNAAYQHVMALRRISVECCDLQTTVGDNEVVLAALKGLLDERNDLRRQFQEKKTEYQCSREELATAMARYQELYADGGEDGPHREELGVLLSVSGRECAWALGNVMVPQ